MICPKCNANLPEDSVFCPNCGCNIEETLEKIEEEKQKQNTPPAVASNQNETVVVKKNKINIVLAVLLAVALVGCSVLGYISLSLKEEYNALESEYTEAIKKYDKVKNDYDSTEVARKVLKNLRRYENWGYATENFHTDTGVVVLSKYSDAKEITLYSTYGGATFNMDNSEPNVASAIWTEESWYGNTTNIRIKPLKTGASVITITNDKYDNEVNILVIVK